MTCRNGDINFRRYTNTLDYSLDLIKLREVYEKAYRRTNFTFCNKKKEYTNRVINVTFKYTVCEYNHCNANTYIKLGHNERDAEFRECLWFEDGDLAGIQLGTAVDNPVDESVIAPYFGVKNNTYYLKKNPRSVISTSDIRRKLYNDGFWCEGTKYVRWKRSCGSSRVGKCLFIDEKLYSRMHRWERCGLDVKEGQELDLAGFESYISLPSSSIVGTLEIDTNSILIIPDYESVFNDDVVAVRDEGGELKVERGTKQIKNSIWDGQGLIDISAMGEYSQYGMVLLRNLFFKCCCFNCNLQKWFADRGITDVSQLCGYTRAKRIEDIKLVTTPSSIKYVKFGSLDTWLDTVDDVFGVVKHDKQTHFFGGRMVQTHYQLINTLQMSKDEVQKFLEPTFRYMTLLREDPAVMRYHIKYPQITDEFDIAPAVSKNDVVYKMLGITDKFACTKLYYDFKTDMMKSFTKNLKLGHVLVDGNYSTMCGNPIEMLLATIGKFDGRSQIGIGNVHSSRFAYGKRLLGSRSPHISMSNVWIPMNADNEEIDTYFNFTDEIICINSIGENILNCLSGADFDSDSVLITDNDILIKAAARNVGKFPIAVNEVTGIKTHRTYTHDQQADLDIRTSNNLIGDIINLSQELNTMIWDGLNNGASLDDMMIIYYDVCKLNVMSNIEIDKAKREFAVSNSKELMALRTKYARYENGRAIKPNFFGSKDRGKGYYDTSKKCYVKHDTAMDYLQECVNSYRARRSRMERKDFIPFADLITTDGYTSKNVTRSQVKRVIDLIEGYTEAANNIYSSSTLDPADKHKLSAEIRQDSIEYIGNLSLTRNTMICLLLTVEQPQYSTIRRRLFNTLFGYPNAAFFALLKESRDAVSELEETPDGDIEIYGLRFRKATKTPHYLSASLC